MVALQRTAWEYGQLTFCHCHRPQLLSLPSPSPSCVAGYHSTGIYDFKYRYIFYRILHIAFRELGRVLTLFDTLPPVGSLLLSSIINTGTRKMLSTNFTTTAKYVRLAIFEGSFQSPILIRFAFLAHLDFVNLTQRRNDDDRPLLAQGMRGRRLHIMSERCFRAMCVAGRI